MTRVGVCVPVAHDPEGIRALLGTLPHLDHPRADLFVVVVVDGGDEPTLAAAREGGADLVLPLVPNSGSYAARNRALDALPDDVEVVVFTDADCLPRPTWISAHLAALQEVDASGGAVVVTLPTPPTAASVVDRDRHLKQEQYVRVDGYAATANLAVRREVVDGLRFDERLRTGGDSDFGRRLALAGHTLAYSPEAAVEHPARDTSAAVYTKVRRICDGMPDLADHWRTARLSRPRPRPNVVRRARAEGVSRGPLWEARVLWVDWRCQLMLSRSAARLRRQVTG